jgi:hypothetical protein
VRDPGHLLDYRPALVVEKHLAVLVTRFALEHARTAELLAGLRMLPLQHGNQLIALDRAAAPHPELRERVVRAEPQRRGASPGAALETLWRQLVIAAHEPLRSRVQLEAIVARPRRIGAVPHLDHDLGQRQQRSSSSHNELMGRSVAGDPDGVRLVRLSEARERSPGR